MRKIRHSLYLTREATDLLIALQDKVRFEGVIVPSRCEIIETALFHFADYVAQQGEKNYESRSTDPS